MTLALALILFAYLIGSVSAAIIVCRLSGLPDPRTEGSGNPGATNVLRIGGKRAAALTLGGDFLKGVLPVMVAQWAGVDGVWLALIALAAFLGHLYPLFFRFQGGKGVATALGVMLALSWKLALTAVLTWLIVARLSGISSLSAMVAALLAPLYAWQLGLEPPLLLMLSLLSLLLLWRHRSNIRKIVTGEESKIGDRK
ncbi:MAG: glycerol-3-phosphate 1-O-acyltransferase PlsY [Gammaproteobacteria bacterium]|nr:glycerol-3-phosphate 1-O-acyltransferase PlsY [Gammaproteobacteria bacterium]